MDISSRAGDKPISVYIKKKMCFVVIVIQAWDSSHCFSSWREKSVFDDQTYHKTKKNGPIYFLPIMYCFLKLAEETGS